MKKRLLLVAAICLSISVFALPRLRPHPAHQVLIDTAGHETREEGAYWANGWNVADRGDATFKSLYERYQLLLAEPVTGFDGQCQTFRLGRICYTPGNPAEWLVEFANLGAEDMRIEGYTPKPGSSPAPAVRDWLQSQLEDGTDIVRVVGHTISEPVCDRDGRCIQWTDKQRFEFDRTATRGDQVQRAPLGLWLAHPASRPLPPAKTAPPALGSGWLLGAILVAGVAILLVGKARQPVSSGLPV